MAPRVIAYHRVTTFLLRNFVSDVSTVATVTAAIAPGVCSTLKRSSSHGAPLRGLVTSCRRYGGISVSAFVVPPCPSCLCAKATLLRIDDGARQRPGVCRGPESMLPRRGEVCQVVLTMVLGARPAAADGYCA